MRIHRSSEGSGDWPLTSERRHVPVSHMQKEKVRT